MRKKNTCFVLLAAMVLMLSGCGSKNEETSTAVDTKPVNAVSTEVPGTENETENKTENEDSSTEGSTSAEAGDTAQQIAEDGDFHDYITDADLQIALIKDKFPVWRDEEMAESGPYYAVTDLDHNGRMEIILSMVQGTGMYSYSEIYEVSEDRTKLERVSLSNGEGESQPDIIVDTVNVYYSEKDNTYYYIFDDILSVSNFEHLDTLCALSFQNGEAKVETIATLHQMAGETGETVETEYRSADGTVITAETFYGAVEKRFSDLKPMFAEISWFEHRADQTQSAEDADLEAYMKLSWSNFSISNE